MSQCTRAIFRQKKAAAKISSNAALTVNLSALIMNNDEDDSCSNTHFVIPCHHVVDIETDFDINDGHSIKSIAHLQNDENTNGSLFNVST